MTLILCLIVLEMQQEITVSSQLFSSLFSCFHNQVLIRNHPLNQPELHSSTEVSLGFETLPPPTPLPSQETQWSWEAAAPNVGGSGTVSTEIPAVTLIK